MDSIVLEGVLKESDYPISFSIPFPLFFLAGMQTQRLEFPQPFCTMRVLGTGGQAWRRAKTDGDWIPRSVKYQTSPGPSSRTFTKERNELLSELSHSHLGFSLRSLILTHKTMLPGNHLWEVLSRICHPSLLFSFSRPHPGAHRSHLPSTPCASLLGGHPPASSGSQESRLEICDAPAES